MLAEKYYDHHKKPKVNICILPTNSSAAVGPYLPAYLTEEMTAFFSQSHQFTLLSGTNHELDCVLKMAVLDSENPETTRLLLMVLEPETRNPVDADILEIDDIVTTTHLKINEVVL